MKIRLAKKIMERKFNNLSPYWKDITIDYFALKLNRDHRITKAVELTKRWKLRKVKNDAKKFLGTNPLKAKDLHCGAKNLKKYSV